MLAQFVSIDMCPPMTVAQASTCVPLLQQKLNELRHARTILPVMQEMTHDTNNVSMPPCVVEVRITPCDPAPVAVSDEESLTMTSEDTHPEDGENGVESEHPDDQSEKSLLEKQLSGASDEDTIESIAYKLQVLDSLCNSNDKTNDNFIA